MNHSRDKLDECVFDYLPIQKIFIDIMQSTGHRCEGLTEILKDRIQFTSTCYGLNNSYKNIIKEKRGDIMCLGFIKDKDRDFAFDDSVKYRNWDDFKFGSVVKSICDDNLYKPYENAYFSRNFDSEPLIHELIRYGSRDVVETLIEDTARNIDINCLNARSQTPLDVAIELGDKRMILSLIEVERKRERAIENEIQRVEKLKECVKLMDIKKTQSVWFTNGMYVAFFVGLSSHYVVPWAVRQGLGAL
jgi:hypothetical protein